MYHYRGYDPGDDVLLSVFRICGKSCVYNSGCFYVDCLYSSAGRKVRAVLFATAGFVCSFHHELSILKYNKANGSYFLKWMAERGSLPNILIWEKFGLIGYCLVVAAVLSIIWFIWRAWRYANKKGNVCDEVISITAFVHFALAGTYFVAEMAFPDGNYFWGNNLPFFTGTLENNLCIWQSWGSCIGS